MRIRLSSAIPIAAILALCTSTAAAATSGGEDEKKSNAPKRVFVVGKRAPRSAARVVVRPGVARFGPQDQDKQERQSVKIVPAAEDQDIGASGEDPRIYYFKKRQFKQYRNYAYWPPGYRAGYPYYGGYGYGNAYRGGLPFAYGGYGYPVKGPDGWHGAPRPYRYFAHGYYRPFGTAAFYRPVRYNYAPIRYYGYGRGYRSYGCNRFARGFGRCHY